MHRMYVSVSRGGWRVSARSVVGLTPEVARELFANISSPRGRLYQLLPPPAATDSLTFVADTFSVLLDRPIPWVTVPAFELSLETAVTPFLGESGVFLSRIFMRFFLLFLRQQLFWNHLQVHTQVRPWSITSSARRTALARCP